ncbi:bifunctional cyclohexadienyl dehydrogenase/ 3-phosphoshikimate 1-carboxyvinyltransferase [Oleiphilus messinensis]|uniref:3-phosphoshikimate 1-carboxyvinyltransferase n=1 Tax=Oleiphilus messinensis TaxID=141451 RepID=A0A1Y0IAG0_9GAMM|nr:bifunctional prephenate dehydrogenase/3-phosphoshikimate 1-carboxyvinyltransferase [Oleiphilus messinensis]ARU57507.1 bifunctional cyclohexadienyl dehydrogenase/ 3-phosphoshikimate 1-carboxyvinyltransferase [Oleiphilus messinensis]
MSSISKLAVIGLGLIGGSLAKALKINGFAGNITGYDLSFEDALRGVQLGIVDEAVATLSEAVEGAEIIIVATPVRSLSSVFSELVEFLPKTAVLTDVGSVKGEVVKAAQMALGDQIGQFVPGHPIAGSEKSGVSAADETLFQHHRVILTPLERNDPEQVELVRRMWECAGAEVIEMAIRHHDEVLAATSHLPHLIAFSLVDTLAGEDDNKEIFKYAAGGFRDFTRIAASDPVMWRDIFLSNRDAVLKVLGHFSEGLSKLQKAIETGDEMTLSGVFTRAKSAREHFSKILELKSYTTMTNQNVTFTVRPGGSVQGDIRVPGDKSISHRSIMLGSLSEGITEIDGFLEGEDALATLQSFRDMGVVIEGPEKGHVTVHGVGMQGLKKAPGTLYVGNSGTSMRLLAGLLAAQDFESEMIGDESLSKRPMERVAVPLRLMGAQVETGDGGRPPLRCGGGQALQGIKYEMPMASAQVKSCVLLAGMYAEGETVVTEPAPTRDHTERMLRGFGYPVSRVGDEIKVVGGGKLTATKIDVPADISSAAFFMVAASITPGADLLLRHVGINPTRTGVIDILKLMGADITLSNEREVGGEPVADIRVRYAPLKGIHIPEALVPLAIDEFPVLFIAATCAEGTTVLSGAEELRVKESDRIQVMADGLSALGVQTLVKDDGIEITGQTIAGGEVESHGDHRIAMSFSVAALRSEGEVTIRNCANVATSFPNFVELANEVGLSINVVAD